MQGKLDNKDINALWDTGAQVSIVSKTFLTEYYPNKPRRDLSEQVETDLKLTAANGSVISYTGWVELTFSLSFESPQVQVPFLVTTETMEYPIIGYNVIEEVIKSKHDNVISDIQSSFDRIDKDGAQTLVNLVQNLDSNYLCDVKTSKRGVVIPKSKQAKVQC